MNTRITGTDWLDGGLAGEDAAAFAKGLKQAGLNYIDVSSGNITVDKALAEAQSAVTRVEKRNGVLP